MAEHHQLQQVILASGLCCFFCQVLHYGGAMGQPKPAAQKKKNWAGGQN